MKYRICHCPIIGSDHMFYVYSNNLKEVKKIMDVLAAYDLFQAEKRIKPDSTNCQYVEMWDENEGEWVDWEIDREDEFCDDIDEYFCDDEEIQEFDDKLFGQHN